MVPIALCALSLATTSAQVQVERRQPVPSSGELHVDNAFGKLTIRGWEHDEVLVRGTLAAGADDLDLEVEDEGVDLHVHVPESWFYAKKDDSEYRTTLEIFVPAGYGISVETTNADIAIEGLAGGWEIESVNGSIVARGNPRVVDVETVTGDIEIHAEAAEMDVETISGNVTLSGVVGEADVTSASGAVRIEAGAASSIEVQTTTGPVTLRATPERECEIEIETFSGDVALHFPSDVRAKFDLRSFSGKIVSDRGPAPVRDNFQPYQRLRFNTGLDGCEVRVQSHDSQISLHTEMKR